MDTCLNITILYHAVLTHVLFYPSWQIVFVTLHVAVVHLTICHSPRLLLSPSSNVVMISFHIGVIGPLTTIVKMFTFHVFIYQLCSRKHRYTFIGHFHGAESLHKPPSERPSRQSNCTAAFVFTLDIKTCLMATVTLL